MPHAASLMALKTSPLLKKKSLPEPVLSAVEVGRFICRQAGGRWD